MKTTYKRTFWLLIMITICGFFLKTDRALAAVTEITDSNAHTFSGSAGPILVKTGNSPTITLSGVSISGVNDHVAAIEIEAGASATIILADGTSNTLIGGTSGTDGQAGIQVPEHATVMIGGEGALTVTGGEGVNAGAGIGAGGSDDCGTVEITGGIIDAHGGKETLYSISNKHGGGGAGIGGAGLVDTGSTGWNWMGSIKISGGTVTATGYDGGAGIGTGGCSGDTGLNGMNITIDNGIVNAYSKFGQVDASGAGIGGGAGSDSGIITITNGTVTAYGGNAASGTDGGAGIGAGKNHPANKITISGGTIFAQGYYGAAGIGGGYGDGVTDGIYISYNPNPYAKTEPYTEAAVTKVTAIGGNMYSGAVGSYVGGAGIGTGAGIALSHGGGNLSFKCSDEDLDEDSDEKFPTILAYSGGYGASGIGLGTLSYPHSNATADDLTTKIHFDSTIDLLAINPDATADAIALADAPFQSKPSTVAPVIVDDATQPILVYYTSERKTGNSEGNSTHDNSLPKYPSLPYKISGSQLAIDEAEGQDLNFAYFMHRNDDPNKFNWAVLSIVISHQWVSGSDTPPGATPPADVSQAKGKTHTPTKPTADGYTFLDWFTDPEGTKPYVDGKKINTNTILYGKWQKIKTSAPPEGNGGTGTGGESGGSGGSGTGGSGSGSNGSDGSSSSGGGSTSDDNSGSGSTSPESDTNTDTEQNKPDDTKDPTPIDSTPGTGASGKTNTAKKPSAIAGQKQKTTAKVAAKGANRSRSTAQANESSNDSLPQTGLNSAIPLILVGILMLATNALIVTDKFWQKE